MSKKKNKLELPRRKNLKKTNLFFVALLILIFIPPVIISYLPFYPPFLPKVFVYSLDNVFASIPFIPKTSKQVLTRGLFVNRSLQNYSPSIEVILKTDKGKKLAQVSLKGKISDAALFTSHYQAKLQGGFESQTAGVVNLEEQGGNFFFQVEKPVVSPFIDLSQTQNNWYRVDLSQFEKNLGVNVRDDNQILNDVAGSFENLRASLSQSIPSGYHYEEIGGQQYYKFDFSIQGQEQQVLTAVSLRTLTIWISKDTFVLSKVYLQGNLKQDLLNATSVSQNNQVNFEVTYSLLPENFTPAKTGNPIDISAPIDLWLNLNNKQNDKSTETFFEATTASKDFGANFLTLERLLKVIFLLPKAV